MLTERQKQFEKHIREAASRHFVVDVFGDAVHMMALSLWRPLAKGREEAVEQDYAATKANTRTRSTKRLQGRSRC